MLKMHFLTITLNRQFRCSHLLGILTTLSKFVVFVGPL